MYLAGGRGLMERMTTGVALGAASPPRLHGLRQAARNLGYPLVVLGALVLVGNAVLQVAHGMTGLDSHAYWLAARSEHPYQAAPGAVDGYFYSPLFVQIVRPVAALPWAVFCGLWALLEAACFWWVTTGVSWRWRLPLLSLALTDVVFGNIYGLYAVALTLGLRYPALWAFPLLTKITPALSGLVWFAARGEWGSIVKVAALSSALVAVSYAADPQLWREWVSFLLAHRGGGMWVRLLVAVPLMWWAARRARGGWLPLATMILVPTWFGTIKDWALMSAVPATRRDDLAA